MRLRRTISRSARGGDRALRRRPLARRDRRAAAGDVRFAAFTEGNGSHEPARRGAEDVKAILPATMTLALRRASPILLLLAACTTDRSSRDSAPVLQTESEATNPLERVSVPPEP